MFEIYQELKRLKKNYKKVSCVMLANEKGIAPERLLLFIRLSPIKKNPLLDLKRILNVRTQQKKFSKTLIYIFVYTLRFLYTVYVILFMLITSIGGFSNGLEAAEFRQ